MEYQSNDQDNFLTLLPQDLYEKTRRYYIEVLVKERPLPMWKGQGGDSDDGHLFKKQYETIDGRHWVRISMLQPDYNWFTFHTLDNKIDPNRRSLEIRCIDSHNVRSVVTAIHTFIKVEKRVK